MKIIAHWQDAITHNNEDLINALSGCHNIVHISLPIRRDVMFNFVRQLEMFWEAWKMQGMLFEVAQSFRCGCDVQRFRKSNVRICPRALQSTVWPPESADSVATEESRRRILISKRAFGLVRITECVSLHGGAQPRVHVGEVIRLVTKKISSFALLQKTQEL